MKVHFGHLYGNLLNTYGDNGNLLMLRYLAEKRGWTVETTIISLDDDFDPAAYDLLFMGGGQDTEQIVVAKDLARLQAPLRAYIEEGGVLLAICGGYQLLGRYYETAYGEKIIGAGVLGHHTLYQEQARFIGDVTIHSDLTGDTYVGFENHNGRTYLAPEERPLGRVIEGYGNNGEDGGEGAVYKNAYGSYFHGPLLVRNPHLAEHLLDLVEERRRSKA